jgi:anti-anti-sigma factor
MQIEHRANGDLMELMVTGVLDNESSTHFRDAVDERVREGWHRILVHMQGVTYISSAGISVLVMMKKRLEQLQGQFGICAPTPEVERTLSLTRLLDVLRYDPEQARAAPPAGEYTRSLSCRIAREDGLDLQIYSLDAAATSKCHVIGDPRPLFESSFTKQDCRSVELRDGSLAIGLGALGDGFDAVRSRFGELLAVAGAVTQSAQSRRQVPDYSLSQGEFTPRAQVLYGLHCEGAYSQLMRFHPVEPDAPVGLSNVVGQCLQQGRCPLAGVVILAETAGLLGAHLRRSPAEAAGAPGQRFRVPEVREWLSFSPERVYSRNLALIVGVARTAGADQPASPVDNLLRPLDAQGILWGHFHAAVFPYRPLKKRTLDLHESVREQFESGTIQDVLHLLRDDRSLAGVGESELLGGACWVSPISGVVV